MGSRSLNKKDYDGKTPLPDPKQELFCELYNANGLPSFWGNAQNSYAFAYEHYKKIDKLNELIKAPAKARSGKFKTIAACEAEIARIQNVCRAAGSRLLLTVNIRARVNVLLDRTSEFNIVDRELLWTIQQRKNPEAKVAAIKHHDQRTQRVLDKVEIKHAFEPIEVVTITKPVKIKT